MKRWVLVIMLCIMLVLTGCNNSSLHSEDNATGEDATSSTAEDVEQETAESKPAGSKISGTEDAEVGKNSYYTVESKELTNSLVESDEGDKGAERKRLKEPYKLFGIIQNKDSGAVDDGYEDVDDGSAGLDSDDYFEYTFEDEDTYWGYDDAPEYIDKSNEEIKNKQETAYEIQNKVVIDIYQSGVLLLDNVNSEEEFNRAHKVTLATVLKNTQNNLEQLDSIGETLRNEFGNNEELIKSWESLSEKLNEYKNTLNIMDGQQEVILKREKLSSRPFVKLVDSFSENIAAEVGNYVAGEVIVDTSNNYDWAGEQE